MSSILTQDEHINFDRLVTAVVRIADALTQLATIEEKRLLKEQPPEVPKRAAEIIKADHSERKDHFSDSADPDWFKETEAATGPSRFQQKFDAEHPGKSAEKPSPKKRSVSPVH